jgi:hypothetical protein
MYSLDVTMTFRADVVKYSLDVTLTFHAAVMTYSLDVTPTFRAAVVKYRYFLDVTLTFRAAVVRLSQNLSRSNCRSWCLAPSAVLTSSRQLATFCSIPANVDLYSIDSSVIVSENK